MKASPFDIAPSLRFWAPLVAVTIFAVPAIGAPALGIAYLIYRYRRSQYDATVAIRRAQARRRAELARYRAIRSA